MTSSENDDEKSLQRSRTVLQAGSSDPQRAMLFSFSCNFDHRLFTFFLK